MDRIRVAHSPDSDDAFMFHALVNGRIDTGRYRFENVLSDIETLNRKAHEGVYEVTAVSYHAYAHVHRRYALLTTGSSMGEDYGPIVVARPGTIPSGADPRAALRGRTVAIPGPLTSAHLALRLYQPDVRTEVVPFDAILEHVLAGKAETGLVIHEGQLTYAREGLERVVDLGCWWRADTAGLPLPLGGNAIRRDLGPEAAREIGRLLKAGIAYALDHREEALDHAQSYGRGLDRAAVDRFVGMYVNRRTLDCGPDGREAVRRFLEHGHRAGIVPELVTPDWVQC